MFKPPNNFHRQVVIERAAYIVLLLLSMDVSAQTHFVSDIQYVPVRSGPSLQHRILHKGLRSGTAVELIDGEQTEGWLNIRFGSGNTEGWIPTQYVLNRPTSAIRLAQKTTELDQIKKRHAELNTSSKQVSGELGKLKNELTQKESELNTLTAELRRVTTLSAGAIKLDQDYRALVEQHERLKTSNDVLNAENENLKSDRRFSHMFYGAGLVVIGMFMAVIIPRMRLKKRHSDWA